MSEEYVPPKKTEGMDNLYSLDDSKKWPAVGAVKEIMEHLKKSLVNIEKE